MSETLLEELKVPAATLEASNFARRYEGLYLLGAYSTSQEAGDDQWAFHTMGRGKRPSELRLGVVSAEIEARRQRFVMRVEKTDRNPFAGRISVGRAPNNDIVLRHPSVSKLHAQFVTEPTSDHLTLVDVGSRNGTLHNRQPLAADEPRSVRSGDRVRFGDMVCELLRAELLYHQLRMLYPRLSRDS